MISTRSTVPPKPATSGYSMILLGNSSSDLMIRNSVRAFACCRPGCEATRTGPCSRVSQHSSARHQTASTNCQNSTSLRTAAPPTPDQDLLELPNLIVTPCLILFSSPTGCLWRREGSGVVDFKRGGCVAGLPNRGSRPTSLRGGVREVLMVFLGWNIGCKVAERYLLDWVSLRCMGVGGGVYNSVYARGWYR